jgi:type 1 glutamine amidotransferase
MAKFREPAIPDQSRMKPVDCLWDAKKNALSTNFQLKKPTTRSSKVRTHMKRPLFTLALGCGLLGLAAFSEAADRKLILIAGKPSHPPGMHEFRAGSLLLQKCLAQVPGLTTLVYSNGWPTDESVFQGADAVVIYADGGNGHPALQQEHMKFIDDLVKKGVGFGCMHYACEVPKDKAGKEFLDWIGGYYEHQYSCNPMWTPRFEKFPTSPITRGVQPFGVLDEWYFNIRFRPDNAGIVPILIAKPTDEVRKGPYVYPRGPYEHIVAAAGRDETMMWSMERPGGGRGFGFTGGHHHKNWGDDNYRKVVLNALLWVAKVEVPKEGVPSAINPEELAQNQDPKGKK